MATKKYSVLAVLDVLKEYSDEEHCLKIKDIKEHIQKPPYKIDVSEKTIRSDLRALYDFGYDIRFANSYSRVMVHSDGTVLDSEINTGCYLVGEVSDEDIEILYDALLSEKYLPDKKYKELVGKLTGLSSTVDFSLNEKGAAKEKPDIVAADIMYDNIRRIRKAIVEHKNITFRYTSLGNGNVVVWQRGKTRCLSPGRVFKEDGVYYLAGFERTESEGDQYTVLRIELMRDVEQTDRPRYDYYDISMSGLDKYYFARKRFKLMTDDQYHVSFKFPDELGQAVIDYFGPKSLILKAIEKEEGKLFYTAQMTMPSGAVIKFAKMYAPDVEILGPADLRDALKKDFAAAAKKHK